MNRGARRDGTEPGWVVLGSWPGGYETEVRQFVCVRDLVKLDGVGVVADVEDGERFIAEGERWPWVEREAEGEDREEDED